ncbi:hypothetical protein L3Q82_024366, partial [Scortum barcoo]
RGERPCLRRGEKEEEEGEGERKLSLVRGGSTCAVMDKYRPKRPTTLALFPQLPQAGSQTCEGISYAQPSSDHPTDVRIGFRTGRGLGLDLPKSITSSFVLEVLSCRWLVWHHAAKSPTSLRYSSSLSLPDAPNDGCVISVFLNMTQLTQLRVVEEV